MFLSQALFPNQKSNYFYQLNLVHKLAIISICLLPVFHLTFDDWTGYWVVLSSIFSLISIYQHKESIQEVFGDSRSKWVVIALLAYPSAIFLSQLCRWSFNHKSYLDTSPFLYFIPVFIFITWKRIDMGKWLQIVLPIMIIGSLWSCIYLHRDLTLNQWGPDRLTTYFSDPLAFGQIMGSLALMSLCGIRKGNNKLQTFVICGWSILGCIVGIYLSVKSGSRTGWLAVPCVLFLILIAKLNWNLKKSIPLGIILSTLCCWLFYHLSPTIHGRIDLAIQEITTYPWNGGMAPETSVGLRITFQRLGWFYFSQSPIYGWGTGGYAIIKDAPEVLTFSTQFARDFVSAALFHNELMTQMVRYGILGILGYFFSVLIPLCFAFKKINSNNPVVSQAALLCCSFLICQIVAGFSDEFLNLKGMVTFYAFILSSLMGAIIAHSKDEA